MRVILRTHGGLGNQLFQIAYGRLLARSIKAALIEIHDLRYRTPPARSADVELGVTVAPVIDRFISYLRIPKLLLKTKLSGSEKFSFGQTIYCDGYFQNESQYRGFQVENIGAVLLDLRREVGISAEPPQSYLIHLRLGDFFKSVGEAERHARERLAKAPAGADVITNDESILTVPDVAQLIADKQLRLISTADLSAENVLRLMAKYKTIDANDSTLVFWASVFSGGHVDFQSAVLRKCRDYFRVCLETAL